MPKETEKCVDLIPHTQGFPTIAAQYTPIGQDRHCSDARALQIERAQFIQPSALLSAHAQPHSLLPGVNNLHCIKALPNPCAPSLQPW